MKTLFISALSKDSLDNSKISEISKHLTKNISIAYSIQYKPLAEQAKLILSKKHKICSFFQVLGCTSLKLPKQTQAIILIGSGKFHAVSLAFESKLPTYLLENNKLLKISKQEVENIEKKKNASYLRYLNADKAGILISTKLGQQNLKKALEFKNKAKDKKFYLYICNNINKSEFENFGISSWINTACPKLDFDVPIINIRDLKELV